MKKELLVIVDMQNDFLTGALPAAGGLDIIPRIAEYAKIFNGDIAFTRDTHTNNYMETQEGRRLPVPHCIKGSEGWKITDGLKDVKAKYMFDKPTFGSLDLGEFVKRERYTDVHLVGVCTGICVLSNALLIKAFCPETTIVVHSDMCACVTPESHETALAAMATCQVEIRDKYWNGYMPGE